MPFESVPNLADGQILSAAWLNTLGRNGEYLNGLLTQPNIPFGSVQVVEQTVLDEADGAVWGVRHYSNYLHWRMYSYHGIDSWQLWYVDEANTATEILNQTGFVGGGIKSGVVDLSAFAFVQKSRYILKARLAVNQAAGSILRVDYLFESERGA